MRQLFVLTLLVSSLACGPANPPPQEPAPADQDAASVEPVPEPTPPAAEGYDHVTLTAVTYYASGPMQDRPPDGEIPAGVPCRVLPGGMGPYAEIETADGTHGWVSADALGPYPAPETPAPPAP